VAIISGTMAPAITSSTIFPARWRRASAWTAAAAASGENDEQQERFDEGPDVDDIEHVPASEQDQEERQQKDLHEHQQGRRPQAGGLWLRQPGR
jgi:hypothetical protein